MINFVAHGRADLAEQVAYSIEVPVVPGDCLGDVEHVAREPIPSALVRRRGRMLRREPESLASTASASSSASRSASVIPCVVIGSLK